MNMTTRRMTNAKTTNPSPNSVACATSARATTAADSVERNMPARGKSSSIPMSGWPAAPSARWPAPGVGARRPSYRPGLRRQNAVPARLRWARACARMKSRDPPSPASGVTTCRRRAQRTVDGPRDKGTMPNGPDVVCSGAIVQRERAANLAQSAEGQRPPLRTRPGRAPVCSPRSTTTRPSTTTHATPSGNCRGSS